VSNLALLPWTIDYLLRQHERTTTAPTTTTTTTTTTATTTTQTTSPAAGTETATSRHETSHHTARDDIGRYNNSAWPSLRDKPSTTSNYNVNASVLNHTSTTAMSTDERYNRRLSNYSSEPHSSVTTHHAIGIITGTTHRSALLDQITISHSVNISNNQSLSTDIELQTPQAESRRNSFVLTIRPTRMNTNSKFTALYYTTDSTRTPRDNDEYYDTVVVTRCCENVTGNGNAALRSTHAMGITTTTSVSNTSAIISTPNSTSTRNNYYNNYDSNSTTSGTTTITTTISSSSSSSKWTSQSSATSSIIDSPTPIPVHQNGAAAADDDNDDAEQRFERFKLVFVYGGVPIICLLLVVWFFCSQTRRQRRAVSGAAANERATWSSRDQAPASTESSMIEGESSSSGRSTLLSGLSSESVDRAVSSIAPLRPAYSTRSIVGLSLDDAFLAKKHGISDDSRKVPVLRLVTSRSVDVNLLAAQLASRHSDMSSDTGGMGTVKRSSRWLHTAADGAAVNVVDRLYVETPSPLYSAACKRQQSQCQCKQPKRLISLPYGLTTSNCSGCSEAKKNDNENTN